MTGWLLDTNVLSELRRPRPEPKVLAFVSAQPLASLYVSTVSLAEIRFGIERLGDEAKRAALRDWLDTGIRPMFEGRVLPVTEDVMLRWRILVEEGRRVRHTFSQPDLIIAATALQNGCTVVTRNLDDYRKTGVALVDPWAGDMVPG
ncbi:twitching motility protein PilT [Methylobacterium sp. Leaf123]|uniref:type II toxin-antitoxin system VapC family toxin n=1 Tax=Methylobacterium sp. Leaf123 TaxID=1736264 RepID=UPI0006F480D5|nr:type II toxin-antitoxin system VapC family toxin [Methylobacterium sp. Leaf123]KQQ30734.1 twitching motility protein PilT [Methylobacterium sp. Leaf123]